MADNVKGVEKLLAALRNLPKELQGPVMQEALLRGAQLAATEIKAVAPVDKGVPPRGKSFAQFTPGFLKKSIRARKMSRLKNGQTGAQVVAPFYASWIEFGHTLKSHQPENKEIGHVPANPFVRTTLERIKDDIVTRIITGLGDALEKANGGS